jgi:hypothetical protein
MVIVVFPTASYDVRMENCISSFPIPVCLTLGEVTTRPIDGSSVCNSLPVPAGITCLTNHFATPLHEMIIDLYCLHPGKHNAVQQQTLHYAIVK